MKHSVTALLMLAALPIWGRSVVYSPQVKTLQVVVNDDWLSPPVMKLRSDDVLNIGFDELSHNYHRYVYQLEHCEEDWTPSAEIFESDWLEGFNGNPIEDYEKSLNTTVLYTHYRLQIPNERCRLTMSGNYRLHVLDEDRDNEEVLCAEFRVVEPLMSVGLSVTANTDIDVNKSHHQVSLTAVYNGLPVTDARSQVRIVVMQNGREDNQKRHATPSSVQPGKLQWEHCRDLIFEAGNEYHKFEVLDVSHPTMGIDHIAWEAPHYHAYPFTDEPRRNYVYDEDANGAFYIRNSDNRENETTCDYVYVHYKLCPARHYDGANLVVSGDWTTGPRQLYVMDYDETDRSYNATVLQKQGYYSYQYLMEDWDGTTHVVPEEGSFYETENSYQAMVYFRGATDRTWKLVGYRQVTLR